MFINFINYHVLNDIIALKLIGAFKTATLGNVKCDDTKEVEYPPLTIVFMYIEMK